MKGTWKTTGPGRGTWKTGEGGDWTQLAYVVVAVFAVFGLAADAVQALKHDWAELGLIYAAGVGFLVIAVTAMMLVYRWTHPAGRTRRRAALPAGRATTVTATVVPRVPAAAAPQALPAAEERNLLVNRVPSYWAAQAAEARREIER